MLAVKKKGVCADFAKNWQHFPAGIILAQIYPSLQKTSRKIVIPCKKKNWSGIIKSLDHCVDLLPLKFKEGLSLQETFPPLESVHN